MSKHRNELGKQGEEIAAAYLETIEYQILTRNYRHKSGEIDIIALDKGTYVFLEVKTRSNCRYGHPAEAVTVRKQQQISRTAQLFLARHDLFDAPARFDVISVLLGSADPVISHVISAFEVP